MTFDEVLDRVLEMLQRRGRVSYRALTCASACGQAHAPGYGSPGGWREVA